MASKSSATCEGLPGIKKNKQWQRELLMERLRSHSSQHKSFYDLSKAMRMGMLDKRYAIEPIEKTNLQKCLDSMQYCIKVTSRQGLVERLESLSRQLGLKFMDDTKALFISTDMFFLEIVLDSNGSLIDVKVHHECKVEQQSCSELADCLNRGDFADFTAQLEGFSSIYQLNVEPKVKTKAFDAMQAIETDLYNIFQMQNFSKDLQCLMKNSLLGIVLKRRGGHPMRLVYFISPYDLISLESNSLQPLTMDILQNKEIGFSVTVNLEAASANKLQILPCVTFAKDAQTGLEMPVFAPLTPMNSMLLPATYVLRLNKPLPVCYNTLKSMGLLSSNVVNTLDPSGNNGSSNSIKMETCQQQQPVIKSIMSLVIQTASQKPVNHIQKGSLVFLPDQTHCYFFTDNKLLESTVIQSVPFTEPSQVPKILDFLKKQALFYSLLSSCIRHQSKASYDPETVTVLEVTAVSFTQISVSLQHPYEEYIISVDFELRNGNIECTIYSLSNNYDLLSLKLTNIVQKCCSIPITIRSLLKFWDQERIYQRNSTGTVSLGTGPSTSTNENNPGNADCSRSTYGNYNMNRMANDTSNSSACLPRSSGGPPAGMMKIDFNQNSTNGGNIKYKTEINNEDFHECPKSRITVNAVNTVNTVNTKMGTTSMAATINREINSSLGNTKQLDKPQPMTSTSLPSDRVGIDKYSNIWKDKASTIKNCVSITPIIGQNGTGSLMDINKCGDKNNGAIEIVPLNVQSHKYCNGNNDNLGIAQTGANLMSNIVTTKVSSASSMPGGLTSNNMNSLMCDSNVKGKKCLSTSIANATVGGSIGNSFTVNRPVSSETEKKEKKRKKKRDDSPMGPPEKVHSRQNSPAGIVNEIAPGVILRKFPSPSSSPKSSSGNAMLSATVPGQSLSSRLSPKHSPVYISSPKNSNASNSPKSPFTIHSPKHGSSGKPSMSTLKNVTANASPKSNEVTNSSILNTTILGRSLALPTSNTVAAAAAAATIAALKAKEKCSSTLPPAVVSSAAVAAAAAVKSSMNVTSAIQQLKNVNSVNHLMSSSNVASDNVSNFDTNVLPITTTNILDSSSTIRKNVPITFDDVEHGYVNNQFNLSGMTNTSSAGNLASSQSINNAAPPSWLQ